jgi:hypothetical protein
MNHLGLRIMVAWWHMPIAFIRRRNNPGAEWRPLRSARLSQMRSCNAKQQQSGQCERTESFTPVSSARVRISPGCILLTHSANPRSMFATGPHLSCTLSPCSTVPFSAVIWTPQLTYPQAMAQHSCWLADQPRGVQGCMTRVFCCMGHALCFTHCHTGLPAWSCDTCVLLYGNKDAFLKPTAAVMAGV